MCGDIFFSNGKTKVRRKHFKIVFHFSHYPHEWSNLAEGESMNSHFKHQVLSKIN